jgi:hypothetical protein
MAAVHNVTVEKLKSRYWREAVFISETQPDQVSKHKITVECETIIQLQWSAI